MQSKIQRKLKGKWHDQNRSIVCMHKTLFGFVLRARSLLVCWSKETVIIWRVCVCVFVDAGSSCLTPGCQWRCRQWCGVAPRDRPKLALHWNVYSSVCDGLWHSYVCVPVCVYLVRGLVFLSRPRSLQDTWTVMWLSTAGASWWLRRVCVCVCGTVMGSGTRGLWSTGPGLVARTAIRTLISTCHSEQLELSPRGKERERQRGISRDNVDTELLWQLGGQNKRTRRRGRWRDELELELKVELELEPEEESKF